MTPTELKEQIQDLLDKRFIHLGVFPWGALVLFVKKNDGSMMMCIHYRQLNMVTVYNRYPIPYIDDFFYQFQGAQCFLRIDLQSMYHQLRIKNNDIPKIVFRTCFRHYKFLVQSFRLLNALMTFIDMMNRVFSLFIDRPLMTSWCIRRVKRSMRSI